MSVLVVGVSHKTAPVTLLERLALDGDGVHKLLTEAVSADHVTEAAVLATCNRLEVYADVDRFHGSVEELSRLLLAGADEPGEALLPHLYLHYDDAAVTHLFQVASGLDSLAVGESQILGQTREALRHGQELGTVGPSLNTLFQQALRVGKRAHAETGIDRAAPSLVAAALDRVLPGSATDLGGRRVLVVGAGSMAGLATATAAARGASDIMVLNRNSERGTRLAQEYGARSGPLTDLPGELGAADLVITCTGADGLLITADQLPARAIALIDLAMPHDVDPAVADVPGVSLVNLLQLAHELPEAEAHREVAGVRHIVTEEVAAFLLARHQASVTPTVRALRSMATGVVDAELERLLARLPNLDDVARAEVQQTLHRVAEKLLHQPTVRVKELVNDAGAISYAAALAELFALDPEAVDAVTRPEPLP